VFKHIDYPLNVGGSIIITDKEDSSAGEYILNLESIEKGLKLWAASEQYGHHWTNFQNDNADAETGDVFLQFCLFGDCIYS
jgi:hypothetical protein